MTDQKSMVRSKYEKYEMLLVRHKLRKTHDSVKKKKKKNVRLDFRKTQMKRNETSRST